MSKSFESRVMKTGLDLFKMVEKEKPSLFKKDFWTGRIMDWAMKDEAFKVQMFRFVDVFPCLNRPESVARHLQQYFCRPEHNFPKAVQFGLKMVSPDSLTAKVAAKTISKNIHSMGKQFIVGSSLDQAAPVMEKMRKKGFPWVMKILKEEVKSVREEEAFVKDQIEFFDNFQKISKQWKPLGVDKNEMDWNDTPKCVMSVMVSSLYAQYMDKACAFEHSLEKAKMRLRPVLRKAKEINACLMLDMEHLPLRELTLETFKSILEEPEFKGYPHVGIVYQAYLRDAEQPFEDLVKWVKKRRQPIHIRLVKGAFWDEEVTRAKQDNIPVPVFTRKCDTDAMFEKLTRRILGNHDLITFKCASHNIRSISHAVETAKDLKVPENRFEIQMLFGMAENLRAALGKAGYRVRLYAPIGEVIPGMAYLVRRLLENTSNESFLRQSFSDGIEKETLLASPVKLAGTSAPEQQPEKPGSFDYNGNKDFENEPPLSWISQARQSMKKALEKIKASSPETVLLKIGGKQQDSGKYFDSVNPNDPDQILAKVARAGENEMDQAVRAAGECCESWAATKPEKRCQILLKAGSIIREKRFDLAAMAVLEAGITWNHAQAEVNRAVDFLEFYEREMIHLSGLQSLSSKPGESGMLLYEPRGVAAVITGFQRPVSIPAGNLAAALVTGNRVVFQPAFQTPVTGYMIAEIFEQAGLPQGVLNVVSAQTSNPGQYLAGHKDIDLVCFTGSSRAGLKVLEKTYSRMDLSRAVKKSILALTGNNAVIVDDDADLDAAVSGIVDSAFGFQGQKESSCSRLIVLEEIYDKCVEKIRDAADSIDMGAVEDARNSFGAMIDETAVKDVETVIAAGKKQGTTILEKRSLQKKGYCAPLAIFGEILPEHSLAKESVTGAVLAVMKAKDFDDALKIANNSQYALTGGVYSRNPGNIEKACTGFKTGNLYINGSIADALPGRHPFGGFLLSGDGSKTGGKDYLKQFMVCRTIVENTFRSGFAPMK